MSRYRKIEVRTWSDENFRSLSPLQPSGQGLWFYLLTGPQTGPIPGLYRAGRAAMAEELGWDLDDFADKFQELQERGMAQADWKARLVWLPNALKHNRPESPNVVLSWRIELDLLPECPLKREALDKIRQFVAGMGPAFLEAFDRALSGDDGRPARKTGAKPAPEGLREGFPEGLTESGTGTGAEPGTGNPPPAPPAAPDAGNPPGEGGGGISAALLATAMQPFGIHADPGHPQVIALAAQGVTPATMQAACEEAKRTRPDGSISVAYVVGVLKRWKGEADKLDLSGAGVARISGAWRTNDQAAIAKGSELGLTPRPGERMEEFRGRIQARLDNPHGVPPALGRCIPPAPIETRSRKPEGLDLRSLVRQAAPEMA